MRKSLVTLMMLAVLAAATPTMARATPTDQHARADGLRFVPDVEAQFVAMTGPEGGDALGFHKTGTPDPSHCRHYQGMVRVDAADGTPYFLVTRSGNAPEDVPLGACATGDDGLGNLVVVRMESRPKHGERMRSNRLSKDEAVSHTPPPPEDRAVKVFSFVQGGIAEGVVMPDKGYQHPGGMQLVGHTLAVAVESPQVYIQCTDPADSETCVYWADAMADSPTLIQFFDVSNPEAPVFKSEFAPVKSDGTHLGKAGVVAFTPLPNGRYLMATTGGEGRTVFFYRSSGSDLASPDLTWDFVSSTHPEVDDDPQQTLQFLREGDINGDLYLAGVRGHPVFGSDHDKADLYRVECATRNECVPGEPVSQDIVRRGRVITTFPRSGNGRLANGAAASTFYVAPSGELLLYVAEHDNDGPDGTVKAGEWSSTTIVREGSPTTAPTARVDGPHVVDEGGTVTIRGSATPATTKAWIKLYQGTEFRGEHVMADFDDYDHEHFENLFLYDSARFGGHLNTTRSWRWFAPVGCSIHLIDYEQTTPRIHVLHGTGAAVSVADLRTEAPDMYEAIDAVHFGDECAAYYDAPIALEWDRDANGTFETSGSPVSFSTASVDGPSTYTVPARAAHPSGAAGHVSASITVRNVAPHVGAFGLTDAAGNRLGIDVPFALTGMPVAFAVGFTDPGLLDHQTATIGWGNGVSNAHTAFAFDEAFGDGTGSASHAHRYTAPGTYTVTFAVHDDDGGAGTASTALQVRTPGQAVQDMVAALDQHIASPSNVAVVTDLRRARKSLAGTNDRSHDGALAKIEAGNNRAAIAFLEQAVSSLRKAQTGGAAVATEIAVLRQVIAAL